LFAALLAGSWLLPAAAVAVAFYSSPSGEKRNRPGYLEFQYQQGCWQERKLEEEQGN